MDAIDIPPITKAYLVSVLPLLLSSLAPVGFADLEIAFSEPTAERLGRAYSYSVTLSRRYSYTSRGGVRLTMGRCVVVFLLDSSIPFRAVGSSNKVDEE